MNYRTLVEPKRYGFNITHESHILLIGSCFSENIGEKLIGNKLNTLVNPFGILFNPISISNSIDAIIEEKEFKEEDLYFENGLYHSFEHHGKFSGEKVEDVLRHINYSRSEATSFLKKTDVLVITLGSAWVHRFIRSNQIVANCHKVPNNEFNKELLDVDSIVSELKEMIDKLESIIPKLKIIFTISPVRHWKDGAEENTLSKSVLNVAVHKLVKSRENTIYFPAFEMVIDDLRDYRFYKKDMLHPTDVAVDYVWNGFEKSFFTAETTELNKKIGKIVSSVHHKPFNSSSPEHQRFIKKQISMIETLKSQHSQLDFNTEIDFFNSQLV